jgi:nuclear transport factor 2 (NTF2) superfamily protein
MTQSNRKAWSFKWSFRARAFAWRGSRLAVQRVKEAVSEIRTTALPFPVDAADGAVCLMERLWPTFELIDTSSGALQTAVSRALGELIPLVANAPASPYKRNGWLWRLWRAIQDDDAGYLGPVEEQWGELCGNPRAASRWADRVLPVLQRAWMDGRPGVYVKGTDLCLSSLLAARRHRDLLDVLALKRNHVWPRRRYGIRALLAQTLFDDALLYAEASRGLNIPEAAVDAECETILLAAGRREQAYRQYAFRANKTDISVVTFQIITRKYSEVERRQVLADLARWSGDAGKWFTVAKNEAYFDMALEFAEAGRTDPRTLSRASQEFAKSNPRFAYDVGRLAVERILAGDGHQISAPDLLVTCDHFLAAAGKLGVVAAAKRALGYVLARYPNAPALQRGIISRAMDEAVTVQIAHQRPRRAPLADRQDFGIEPQNTT